jgi:uncharacterized GH25 family protein
MGSREDWEIEQEKRKMLQDSIVTEYKKNKFIDEIKSGLGEDILKQPNTVYKKPSLFKRIKKVLGWN